MKIQLTVEEKVYKTLIIDTDDHWVGEEKLLNPFDLAEFINQIKNYPDEFLKDDQDNLKTEKERLTVKIEKYEK